MGKEVTTELSYKKLFATIKQQIQSAQSKAALAVNSFLIQLYWNMGKMIAENQALFKGRNNYVEQLAKDWRAEFSEMKGFSRRNIIYCRKFYLFYSESSVQQPVALESADSVQRAARLENLLAYVPWEHHVVLINKLKDPKEAHFYLRQNIQNNWKRAIGRN